MIRRNQQKLVLPLVACLLLVPALASPASVAHEVKHAHHNAATHSSPLCSWLCGAGQGFHLADSLFVPTITFLAVLDMESADRVDDTEPPLFPSRGPPILSL